jgi:hypothetical protein
MTIFTRRTYLAATGTAAAGMIGLAGCSEASAATGTLATRVTDQPGDISDFESCTVTIQGIWLKPSGGAGDGAENGTDEEGDVNGTDEGPPAGGNVTTEPADGGDETDVDESEGREYHEFDEAQEADLVQLQDGNTALLDERELEVREYAFLQLDVTGVEGVLADGGEAEVDTPGNAPLQFKQPFEIRGGQTTTFTGDFTPVRRGQTGRYLLQPVAQGTSVEYADVDEDAA